MKVFLVSSCILAAAVSAEKSHRFHTAFRQRTDVRMCGRKQTPVEAAPQIEDDFDRAEDAIFHAVEAGEKTLLHAIEHAVEDEVDTLFHELPHHDEPEDPMDAAGKRKGKRGKKEGDVQSASCVEGGWRSRCRDEDLMHAIEDCIDGIIE